MRAHLAVEAIEKSIQSAIRSNRRDQQLANPDLCESREVVSQLAPGSHHALHVAAGFGPSLGEADVNAMTDRESVERSIVARGNLARPSDSRRDFFRFHPRAVP